MGWALRSGRRIRCTPISRKSLSDYEACCFLISLGRVAALQVCACVVLTTLKVASLLELRTWAILLEIPFNDDGQSDLEENLLDTTRTSRT